MSSKAEITKDPFDGIDESEKLSKLCINKEGYMVKKSDLNKDELEELISISQSALYLLTKTYISVVSFIDEALKKNLIPQIKDGDLTEKRRKFEELLTKDFLCDPEQALDVLIYLIRDNKNKFLEEE